MLGKQMLAADYGASGGRVMLGSFDGEKISLGEMHRFANEPVILNGKDRSTMYWDFLRLFHELKTGITRAGIMQGRSGTDISSIGVDTWGVDYGLLGKRRYAFIKPGPLPGFQNRGNAEKGFLTHGQGKTL